MKPGGGGKKGRSFENKMAKRLGMWWYGKPFRRVPLSGGWDKLSADDAVVVSGDVYAPVEAGFPFSVELKKQECFQLHNLLTGKDKAIRKWWRQCVSDSKLTGLVPLLIFAKNFHPELAMMYVSEYIMFAKQGDRYPIPHIRLEDVIVMPLDLLLASLRNQEEHRKKGLVQQEGLSGEEDKRKSQARRGYI